MGFLFACHLRGDNIQILQCKSRFPIIYLLHHSSISRKAIVYLVAVVSMMVVVMREYVMIHNDS